jgi:F-type H+-transporting ATPase subunit gamma
MLNLVPKYAFGANLKTLKVRMKSVESIKKITKAMKMIAATKMR